MKTLVRYVPYLLILGIAVHFLLAGPVHMGDSVTVVRGVETIRRSLADGTLPTDSMQVGHFPLYQYVPGLVFSYLGAGETTSLDLFCVLSFLAFAGILALTLRVLGARSQPVAAAAVLVLVTGPLLWYARASFGEMLAAFLILACTAACVRGAGPAATGLLFVLAGLTKETALPCLLLIAAVGLFMGRRSGRAAVRGRLAAVGCAALLTAGLTAAFNCYRFGTPYNAGNIRDLFLVPNLKTQASFFAAQWLSPNGGLLFFWPSFVAALVAVTAVVLRAPRAVHSGLVPLAGVGAVLFLLTLGFSKWFAPFGWPAWGPRLMLPWIPSCVLLLFWYYARDVEAALARVSARPGRWLILLLLLAAASLPQAAVLARPAVYDSFWVIPPFQALESLAAIHYRFMSATLWPRPERVAILACYPAAVRELPVFLTSLAFTLAVVGFGLQVRAWRRLPASAALPSPPASEVAARRAG
jgi:hypothetical protein